MVAWHRLQFPDGDTMELGNMGGADQAGYAGFNDKVNNHYWRIFGSAALLSLISAGAQLSQPDESGNGSEITANELLAAELGRQWGQVGQEMTRRNLNIQPTLEIRPGYRFNVMVNKDLILEPYRLVK
jgi:type IV secretion system protein VirB10